MYSRKLPMPIRIRNRKRAEPSKDHSPFRRRRRMVVFFLFAILIAFLIAPLVISKTPLRSWAIARITSDLNGTVEVGSASISWFSSITLREVEISDPHGSLIATVRKVTTSEPLWHFLFDSRNLGLIQIDAPEIHVHFENGTSNVENLIANWLNHESPNHMELPKVQVEIVDGKLHVDEEPNSNSCLLEIDQATLGMSPDSARNLLVDLKAKLHSGQRSGQVTVCMGTASVVDVFADGNLQVSLEGLPLGGVQAAVTHYLPSVAELQGDVSGHLNLTWGRKGKTLQYHGESDLRAEKLQFAGDAIHPDRLLLEQARFTSTLRYQDGHLQIDDLFFDSSLGSASLKGGVELRSLQRSLVELARQRPRGQLECSGSVDLAAIMNTLPNCLQVRDGVRLESGQLTWDLNSLSNAPGNSKLRGTLQTTDIAGWRGQQRIHWKSPIRAQLNLTQSLDGIRIQKLLAQSTFLSIEANGDESAGSFAAQGDLGRFKHQFHGLFDLADTELNGRAELRLNWNRSPQDQFQVTGIMKTGAIQIRLGEWHLLQEPSISARYSLAGAPFESPPRLTNARLDLDLGNDRYAVSLTQPISFTPKIAVRLFIEGSGDIAANRERILRPTGSEFPLMHGNAAFESAILVAQDRVEFSDTRMELNQFSLASPYNRFPYTTATLSGQGRFDFANRSLVVEQTKLQAGKDVISTKQLTVDLASDTIEADGNLRFRGRIAPWHRLFTSHVRQDVLDGMADGSVVLSTSDHVATFDARIKINDAKWIRSTSHLGLTDRVNGPQKVVWNEPQVETLASGRFENQSRILTLDSFDLRTDSASVHSSGSLQLSQDPIVNLKGEFGYDLDRLTNILNRHWSDQIQLTGRSNRGFTLRGPLWSTAHQTRLTSLGSHNNLRTNSIVSPDLAATFGVNWQRANVYGLRLGETNLDARLHQGVITLAPMTTSVGEGSLHLAPKIDLTGPIPTLVHGKQQVVSKAKITPELCQRWLKYVAPLLADATHAQADFSVMLQHAKLPMNNFWQGAVSGQLQIEEGQVGPGPLAKQILTLIQQIKTVAGGGQTAIFDSNRAWVRLPTQNVPFRLHNGRVRHQGLKMEFGDVTVTTTGWVAADERIQLAAEIPIQQTWVQKQRWLGGLQGQTLRIPIRGTLSQPRLDTRSLRQLTRQNVRGAAEGLLQQELDRQLKRLFQ